MPRSFATLTSGQTVDDIDGRGGRDVVHEFPVDGHDRCMGARGLALDLVQGELAIDGGAFIRKSESIAQALEDRVATEKATAGVGAHADVVRAPLCGVVHRVEGRDRIDLGLADAKCVGAGMQAVGRDRALDALQQVQHRHDRRLGLRIPSGELGELAAGLIGDGHVVS